MSQLVQAIHLIEDLIAGVALGLFVVGLVSAGVIAIILYIFRKKGA